VRTVVRAMRAAGALLVLVAATSIAGAAPASANPGDPTPGWPAGGVDARVGVSRHAEIEVLGGGTVILAFDDEGGAASDRNTKVQRYNAEGVLLSEVTIDQPVGITALVDVDARGSYVYVTVNQMSERGSIIEIRRFGYRGLDTSWGDSGVVRFEAGIRRPPAQETAATLDGFLLIADASVYKFDSAGQIDTTFNGDGRAPLPWPHVTIADAAVDARGRIAIVGTECAPACRGVVVRLDSNGNRELEFSEDGVAQLTHPNSTALRLESVAWASGGRLVVGGMRSTGTARTSTFLTTARLSASTGALDLTYGGNGWASVRVGDDRVLGGAAVVQRNGRVVVVGGTGRRWLVVRFSEAGRRDETFGAGGVVRPLVGAAAPAYATDVAISRSGGRILVAGSGLDARSDDIVAIGSFLMR
jgi:uncharacterized delta-60 repeat protein